jgi:hypothetical protein
MERPHIVGACKENVIWIFEGLGLSSEVIKSPDARKDSDVLRALRPQTPDNIYCRIPYDPQHEHEPAWLFRTERIVTVSSLYYSYIVSNGLNYVDYPRQFIWKGIGQRAIGNQQAVQSL